jgi:N-acetylglucosaminyldiphosphoundecaprenol N-acetyl-beta-D-mannosaminyltransferase
MYERVSFLGSWFDNVSLTDVLNITREHVKSRQPGYMMSLNLDILNRADQDEAFHKTLEGATLILMDSTPLMRLADGMGLRVKEKLSGSDLMPEICAFAAKESFTCLILGGMPGVPETAKKNLEETYPGLRFVGTISPDYGFEKDEAASRDLCKQVSKANPDIMFLCLGEPKAGLFISSHLEELGVPFTFNVGAAVDFAAGNVPRAPLWMQRAGLEWFYRFLREPKRMFRRYFVDSWHFVSIWRRHRRSKTC